MTSYTAVILLLLCAGDLLTTTKQVNYLHTLQCQLSSGAFLSLSTQSTAPKQNVAVLEYSIMASRFRQMGNHNLVAHAKGKQSRNKIGLKSKTTLKLDSSKMYLKNFS